MEKWKKKMSRPRVRDGETPTVERVFQRVGTQNGDHDGCLDG